MEDLDLSFPTDFVSPPLTSGGYVLPELHNMIPDPPDVLPAHNTYPPVEWTFSDQTAPEFDDDIVERTPISSEAPEERVVLTEEDHREILQAMDDNAQVRERLDGQRHTFIGASLRNSPPKRDSSPMVEVLAYDYDEDTALLIRLRNDDLEVDSIEPIDYLPPPTTDEVRHAVSLARRSDTLAEHGVEEMEAGVLRDFSAYTAEGEFAADTGRRRLDVRFRMAGERAPRYYALVDLTTDTVIDAGAVE